MLLIAITPFVRSNNKKIAYCVTKYLKTSKKIIK